MFNVAMRNDDPQFSLYTKANYDLPIIDGALLYATPTAFDKDYIAQNVGCDTSMWMKILKYFGLPIVIISRTELDWNQYYSEPHLPLTIEKSRVASHIDA